MKIWVPLLIKGFKILLKVLSTFKELTELNRKVSHLFIIDVQKHIIIHVKCLEGITSLFLSYFLFLLLLSCIKLYYKTDFLYTFCSGSQATKLLVPCSCSLLLSSFLSIYIWLSAISLFFILRVFYVWFTGWFFMRMRLFCSFGF